MVVDFSAINMSERPVLILCNIDGTRIQPLGYAFNVCAELHYNETSSLSFDVPSFSNGIAVPGYDKLVGTKIIDWCGVGLFKLINPSITKEGNREVKSCTAYSLEYEFTQKTISLENGTYAFYNPVDNDNTIIGRILEIMPSWSVGEIDQSLWGKYRTFDEASANVYDFIKSSLQEKYSCVIDFDTYHRTISAKSMSAVTSVKPVYLSQHNLLKQVEIEESATINEDRVTGRYRPIHYGVSVGKPLSFPLICCVNELRAARGEPLDRWDMEKIASWLTGHQQYKWLHIDQPDLTDIRYRCIITDLQMIEIFGEKQGIQFTVTCDSQYAYTTPIEYVYTISGPTTVTLPCRSSCNEYYYPKIEITNAISAQIINTTDNGRVFSLTSIPASDVVTIDNENQIITDQNSLNIYPYFNFNFFRLKRGDNILSISGNGTYKFICEFPVNVGG